MAQKPRPDNGGESTGSYRLNRAYLSARPRIQIVAPNIPKTNMLK
jgi:hypothetical protein